jgi:lipase (class 3)
MPSDIDFALLCYSSYFLPGYFDTVFQGDQDNQVWCGIKHIDKEAVIVFRGSSTFTDWTRDFSAKMFVDPQLGEVETGFMIGLRDLLVSVKKETASATKIYITGHSLGAARALLFGALLVCEDIIPEIVTFGSPRPGGAELKVLLAPVAIRSYKNAFDPVTDVPFMLSLDPYVHPRDLIPIASQPIAADPWLSIRDHHMQYYINAIAIKLGGYHG